MITHCFTNVASHTNKFELRTYNPGGTLEKLCSTSSDWRAIVCYKNHLQSSRKQKYSQRLNPIHEYFRERMVSVAEDITNIFLLITEARLATQPVLYVQRLSILLVEQQIFFFSPTSHDYRCIWMLIRNGSFFSACLTGLMNTGLTVHQNCPSPGLRWGCRCVDLRSSFSAF